MTQIKLTTIEWDGKQITKPGMYGKIPLDTYHKGNICDGPSVSSSGLRLCFAKSPAHFYDEWPGNPNYEEKEDKEHFVLGRALHHLMLGEAFFAKLFAVQPKLYPSAAVKPAEIAHAMPLFIAGKLKGDKQWHNGAGFCKAWHDEQAKLGKAVLTLNQIEQIKGMAETLGRNPIVRAGALNGMIERSLFWKDKATGLWLKARPDAIPDTSIDFVDLKTTTSVLWPDLQRTIADCGYHQQGALVREAAREVLGIENPTFSLIFIEKTRPFCARVVTLKDNDLDRGERQNHAALDSIAKGLKSKHWPGPDGDRPDAMGIELPEWAQKQIDTKLEFGIA